VSRLVVLATSRVPPGSRGALTQWYVEVLPGILVGSVTKHVRDELWTTLVRGLAGDRAYAVEVTSAPTDQGYTLRTLGDHPYKVEDFHGLMLVTRHHKKASAGVLQGLPDPTW
jgi:CRISPR-associated protein Cas2